MRRWVRDALTGRFTTRKEAKEWPAKTVEETDEYTAALGALRWRISELESVMLQESGELAIIVRSGDLTAEKLHKVAGRLEDRARQRIPEEQA